MKKLLIAALVVLFPAYTFAAEAVKNVPVKKDPVKTAKQEMSKKIADATKTIENITRQPLNKWCPDKLQFMGAEWSVVWTNEDACLYYPPNHKKFARYEMYIRHIDIPAKEFYQRRTKSFSQKDRAQEYFCEGDADTVKGKYCYAYDDNALTLAESEELYHVWDGFQFLWAERYVGYVQIEVLRKRFIADDGPVVQKGKWESNRPFVQPWELREWVHALKNMKFLDEDSAQK